MQQHPHQAAMQQHQHHMFMMQQQQMMMMQQQQMMMQQQQDFQAQQQQDTANLKSEHVEDDVETQQASNREHEHTVEDWHEGLEEEAVQGHEGLTQGASIEELAAAWAQAEAEYEEYVRMNDESSLYR
jgi:peroxin-5